MTFLPLGILLLVSPVAAQSPRVTTEVDTTVVTVGDLINLRVSVEHEPGAQVVWPDSLDLAPFEILSAQTLPPEASGGRAVSTAILTVTAFELGDLEIPSIDLEVVEEGGERTALATNPFGIQVVSVGLDEEGDIRGIKGPLGIPLSTGRLLLFSLLCLLGAALVWVIYRRIRRMMRPGEVMVRSGPAEPWRPPHEIALEALDRLETSPLLARGEIKEFHIRLSDILRTYVERRYQIPALEMTTGEVLQGLENVGAGAGIIEDLERFFHSCDMVKFAKHRPTAEESLSLLQAGRRLVEATIPRPDPSKPMGEPGPGGGHSAPSEKDRAEAPPDIVAPVTQGQEADS